MSRIIATFFYVGHMKPAPGTWGSLAGVIAAVPIIELGGVWALAVGAVIAFAIGVWATAQVAGPENHDPSEVVIDEVAGQWVALLPFAFIRGLFPGDDIGGINYVIALAIGFVFFRLFDILKPWPVSWADRREDPFGVMFDDILAGIMAAIAAFATMYLIATLGIVA
ncbi:MAG: phosphatidylglycerophosphatase A [Pseudomonadota bacterium]